MTDIDHNEQALNNFNNWLQSARHNLHTTAVTLVAEQREQIATLVVSEDIDFRTKLMLLEKHTGGNLYLHEAAGFCPETYDKWKGNWIKISQAQQSAVLEMCKTVILEWLDERLPFEQIVGVVGYDSQPDIVAPIVEKLVQIPAIQVDSSKLLFDPMKPLDEFEWCARVRLGLKQFGITYLGELVQKKEQELNIPQYLGSRSRGEVKFILSTVGAYLGMSAEKYPELQEFNDWLAIARSK